MICAKGEKPVDFEPITTTSAPKVVKTTTQEPTTPVAEEEDEETEQLEAEGEQTNDNEAEVVESNDGEEEVEEEEEEEEVTVSRLHTFNKYQYSNYLFFRPPQSQRSSTHSATAHQLSQDNRLEFAELKLIFNSLFNLLFVLFPIKFDDLFFPFIPLHSLAKVSQLSKRVCTFNNYFN